MMRLTSPLTCTVLLFLLSFLTLTPTMTFAFSCRPANTTLMPYCGSYVTYAVSNETVESAQDAYAAEQHSKSCTYYGYKNYACSKFFQRCVEETVTVNGVPQQQSSLVSICASYCYDAKDNVECSNIFAASYFQTECSLSYYSPSTSLKPCIGASELTPPASVGDGLYWKLGLGIGIGILALVCLGLLYRKHRKENMSEADLEKYDVKRREKLEKEREVRKAAAAASSGGISAAQANANLNRAGAAAYAVHGDEQDQDLNSIELGGLVAAHPSSSLTPSPAQPSRGLMESPASQHRSINMDSPSPVAASSPGAAGRRSDASGSGKKKKKDRKSEKKKGEKKSKRASTGSGPEGQ